MHNDYFTAVRCPFLLGGCGRSGTTLLRLMLDAHRRLFYGPESRVFVLRDLDLDYLSRAFEVEREVVGRMAAEASGRAAFAEEFFRFCCRRAGKEQWGEKTPKNVTLLVRDLRQTRRFTKRFRLSRFSQ